MKSLTILGCVLALLALVWFPIGFAIMAMLLGVVSLIKGRAENGIAVIVLAAGCGYYGFMQTVPLADNLWQSMGLGAMAQASTAPKAPTDWRVVSLQTHVSNADADPVCSWRLELKNESLHPATFQGAIEFQDAQGGTISQGRVEPMQVPAGTVGIFTGSVVLKDSRRVARAVPQINVSG